MIYHAGLTSEAVLKYRELYPETKLKAMISYGRRGKQNYKFLFEHNKLLGSLACDSGTWTLNQNLIKYGDIITSDGYKHYLKLFESKIDFYLNFDADFSRDGFENNLMHQLELEKAGLHPVPVIHDCYGEEVDYYIDKNYPMVAIGSGELAFSNVNELYRIVDKFYRRQIKVHFLGCTNYRKLAYVPVYSCDSSTWGQAGARDYLLYWNPDNPGIDKKDKIYLDHRLWDYNFLTDFENYLDKELNLTLNDLIGRGKHLIRQLVNIHYFVKLEQLIYQKHRKLGFKFV